MNYQGAYLLLALLWFVPAAIVVILEPEKRKNLLTYGIVFAIIGFVVDVIYRIDYYDPEPILNLGIFNVESIIIGFGIGTISSYIYLLIEKEAKQNRGPEIYDIVSAVTTLIVFAVCFYALGINSFIASIVAFVVAIAFYIYRSYYQLPMALLSGLTLLVVSILINNIVEIFYPLWFQTQWQDILGTDFLFLKMPPEDLIWYFLVGLLIALTNRVTRAEN